MLLELKHVTQTYGTGPVVHDLSFSLAAGTIGCLLGPSGCGKSTVLRCIAGFEPIAGGEIRLGGATVSLPGFTQAPEQRRVGMVFQDFALFPHLTVGENVAFGLAGLDKRERASRVEELLETVRLRASRDAYPHEISGGQQQRVALARALAPAPDLLLLDEPFSSLDIELRERLGREVRDILRRQGTTALVVTHDQHEAFAMADVVGVMHRGRIQQWDTPYNLYHRPANRFIADFVGQGVLVPGKVLSLTELEMELGVLQGMFPFEPGTVVDVLLRPDDIVHDDASPRQATIVHKAFRGAEILYTVALPSGTRVLASVPSHHDHALHGRLGIRLEIDHVVAFQQELPPETTVQDSDPVGR